MPLIAALGLLAIVRVKSSVAVQPFTSVTVMLYVPLALALKVGLKDPILPFVSDKRAAQHTQYCIAILNIGVVPSICGVGSELVVTVELPVPEQSPSLTVTV